MRLQYAPSTPPTDSSGHADPTTTQIYETMAARRAPRPLIPLDLTLLLSPPVAAGYNAFVGALRSDTTVPASLLELAICRIAVLNGAIYEWNAHAPLGLKAGLNREILKYCMDVSIEDLADSSKDEERIPAGGDADSWKKGLAVLRFTDESTRTIRVADSTFDALRTFFDERQILELTTVIAGYNGVSRILVALDVGENNDKTMKKVEEM